MKIEACCFDSYKGLSNRYINRFDTVKDLYINDFKKEVTYKNRKEYLLNKEFNRNSLAEALLTYNESISENKLNDSIRQNIELLRKDTTLAVVTGQQAGIFGGPLYTLYKTITAIKLAKKLSKDLSSDVVPIFWIASEDHDFYEIKSASYVKKNKRVQISTNQRPDEFEGNVNTYNYTRLKKSVGNIKINGTTKHLVDKISVELGEDNIFKTALKDGESLSDWFSRIMIILFESHGLIIVDSMDKNIRKIESEFFREALSKTNQTFERLNNNTQKVLEMGEKPLIDIKEENTNLFIQHNEERLSLKKEDDIFYCEGYFGRTEFSKIELENIISDTPELLSTNVVYRPIVQDVLFPTLAYIAGPGETAYYAQISGVYQNFDMEMPVIYPRENYTVVPKVIQKSLERLNVNPEDILNSRDNGIEKNIILKGLNIDIESEFNKYENEFSKIYNNLIENIQGEIPEIQNIKDQNKELILGQIKYLKEKAYRFSRKEKKDDIDDFKKAKAWIYNKNIQERELGFINQKELMIPELIEFLIHETDIDYNHRVVVL